MGRHAATSAEEVAHPARPGIVRGGGKAEIAELAPQFGEEFRRLGEGCLRIERIEQTALIGGVRHELRDPLRAMAAARHRPDGVRLKSALFPDNPGEEFERQSVCRRGGFEHQAHRVDRREFGCRGIAHLGPHPCRSRLFIALRAVAVRRGRRRGFIDPGCSRAGRFVALGAIASRGGRWRRFIIRGFARSRWRLQ